MRESDTVVEDADTQMLDLAVGDRVRVITESFQTDGVFVGNRPQGRLLIRLATGKLLEIARYCVESW
jgi:hypothetical protein